MAGPTCLPVAAGRLHREAQPLICRTLESGETGPLMAGHLASRARDAHQPCTARVSKRPPQQTPFLAHLCRHWVSREDLQQSAGLLSGPLGASHPVRTRVLDMASPTGRRGRDGPLGTGVRYGPLLPGPGAPAPSPEWGVSRYRGIWGPASSRWPGLRESLGFLGSHWGTRSSHGERE